MALPAVNSFRRRTCLSISIFFLTYFSLPVFPGASPTRHPALSRGMTTAPDVVLARQPGCARHGVVLSRRDRVRRIRSTPVAAF
jgi:hypothetical protein